MDLGLTNRVALVAGSSRGIGKAAARAFLAEGCRTVITGRQPDALAATAEALRGEFGDEKVLAWAGDLTQTDTIERMLADIRERWGAIDCLVANIGSGRGKPGWDLTPADWETLFEINLWGSLRLVTRVLSEMTQTEQGNIVLVASITGVETTPAPLPYSAAKAALVNYGKNLSRLVGPRSVRINCVAPGNVLFPGGSWEKHLSERPDEVMRYIESEVPLRRFGQVEEIADLIVFLSSPRAAFITGSCVVADGGQTRGI